MVVFFFCFMKAIISHNWINLYIIYLYSNCNLISNRMLNDIFFTCLSFKHIFNVYVFYMYMVLILILLNYAILIYLYCSYF